MCKGQEKPVMVSIEKVVQETGNIKTFYLGCAIGARPGQFVMIWIPGLDEKPFTLTAAGKQCAITVQKKGRFTKRLFEMRAGDKLGIRGPYGNGFDTRNVEKAAIIAGGCGAAPILTLAQKFKEAGVKTAIVNGAHSGKECLFRKKLSKTTNDLYITTDDGSLGEKGFATDVLEKVLKKEKFDCVFGCGPEIMLKKTFGICGSAKVECQLNLERYMRCGFGVCGACALGKWLVCKDGPVFTGKQLKETKDFGEKALLKSGKEVSAKEYSEWRQ